MAYKAFVSSTFEDMKGHRQVVIAALRKAGIFVDPMEDWTAASDEPKKFSQDRLKDCDLCVLLVGFRRGHVPKGEEMSITQLEYQAAVTSGIDVLVFMLKEDAPWPRKFDELDKDPGIRPFRAELKESKGVGFFDLAPNSIEIAPALTRWIATKSASSNSSTAVVSEVRHRLGTIKRSLGKAADLALKLSEREQYVQGQPTHRGSRVELLGNGDEADLVHVEDLNDFGKVRKRPGKPVNFVNDDSVDLLPLDIFDQTPESWAVHGGARISAIIIDSIEGTPPLVLLTGNECPTSFPLGIERVKGLLQPFFGGLPGIDRTADERFSFAAHLWVPCHDCLGGRRRAARTSASR